MALNIRITASGLKLSAVVSTEDSKHTQSLRHVLNRVGTTATVEIASGGQQLLIAELVAGQRTFPIRRKSGLGDPPALMLGEELAETVFVTVPEAGEISLSLTDPTVAVNAAEPFTKSMRKRMKRKKRKARQLQQPPVQTEEAGPVTIRVVVNDKHIAMVKCTPHHGHAPFRDRLSELLAPTRSSTKPVELALSTTGYSLQAVQTKRFGHEYIVRPIGDVPLLLNDAVAEAILVTFQGDCGRILSISSISAGEFTEIVSRHAA